MSAVDSIKSRLLVYRDLLVKWQKTVNLVSPTTIDDAWNRHFEDSLQMCDLIPPNANVVDIGSGAGFPGLVIAIARPDVKVMLIESDQKKGTFLLAVSRETGANNVDVRVERIESVLPTIEAGIITARALAPLPKLFALTRSAWNRNPDANMLFMKGADWQKEVYLTKQDYVFDLESKSSKTDASAAILCIRNIGVR